MTDEPQDTSLSELHQNKFQCTVCDKTLTTASGLEQHYAVHTGERNHVCEICGRSFRFKSNLFEHVSVHTGSTPYVCPYCGKECRLKGNLKKHMVTHVTSAKELEAAWKPFSARRPPAPVADRLTRHVESVPEGGASETEGEGGVEDEGVSEKISDLSTAADWTARIKNEILLPQIDLDFKIRHLEETLAQNDRIHTMRDLFEFAKPIMCDTFTCPICHAPFDTKDECTEHCQYQHPNVMQQWVHFCEMCYRPFSDEEGLQEHESFHKRVRVYTEEKRDTKSGNLEFLIPTQDRLDKIVVQHLHLKMDWNQY